MAFDRMTDDLDIISKYPDEPYEEDGFTAEAFKASFDQGAKLCKAAINRLVDKLNGKNTGASYLGFRESSSIPADNVQDAIENVQQQIADAYSESAIPQGAVTTDKLADRSVTNVKIGYREVHTENIAEGAVGFDQLADGSVDSVILADKAVRTEKLFDRAVTTPKIADGAVTGAKMSDTGWVAVTSFNGNQFSGFSTDAPPRYRKIGNVVYLTGALKPVSALPTLSPTNVPIEYVAFELPEGYIPSKTIVVLCQGNGDKKWKLQIYQNGRVTVSRYSGNAGYVDLPAGDWLPFHVSFPVD